MAVDVDWRGLSQASDRGTKWQLPGWVRLASGTAAQPDHFNTTAARVPCLLAFAALPFAIAGIALVARGGLPTIWVAVIGLLANAYFVTSALPRQSRAGTRQLAYELFLRLCTDVVSVLALIAALALSGHLQSVSATIVATTYLVMLLCALIKSSAMKKQAFAKWARVGRLARAAVALIVVGSAIGTGGSVGLGGVTVPDQPAFVAAAIVLMIVVVRAARVRAALAARDPAPLRQQSAALGSLVSRPASGF